MAHILASCPLGTNASVGRNLFVRCTRALVHSNAAHGGQKTDGQEETRLGILRPYKVLQLEGIELSHAKSSLTLLCSQHCQLHFHILVLEVMQDLLLPHSGTAVII